MKTIQEYLDELNYSDPGGVCNFCKSWNVVTFQLIGEGKNGDKLYAVDFEDSMKGTFMERPDKHDRVLIVEATCEVYEMD